MIRADVDYPAGLPNPLRDNHTLKPARPFHRTELQSGRAINRRAYSSVPTAGVWNFHFKEPAQAAVFEAWFRDALHDGTKWFNVKRLTPLGMMELTCRFTDIYNGPTLIGRNMWRFECPLEVWERPLLPKGWGEFPEYILGADIIDLAMNREWPEK